MIALTLPATGLSDTVATGALPLAILVAALAGLVSFASPCVLPLVPGFLGYVAGAGPHGPREQVRRPAAASRRPAAEGGPARVTGPKEAAQVPVGVPVGEADPARSRVVLGTLLFIGGFSVIFILGAIFIASLGRALIEHRVLLMRLGGAAVVAMALVFLGAGRQRTATPRYRPPAGLLGAPALGAVFGLGWTPCTGPTLGAVLAMASSLDPSVSRAVILAGAYCAGLGLPFLLLATAWERAGRFNAFLRRHQRVIHIGGGILLLVVGLLLLTGLWDTLTTWLRVHAINDFEVIL